MLSLSPLQLLPPHIVELVVDYVSDYVPPLFYSANYGGDNSEWRLLQKMPLLWVCRNFRDVVYLRYSKVCALKLCTQSNKVTTTWRSWPECLQENVHPGHGLAKELFIKVDAWTIFNGRLLVALSRAPYSGCLFPRVRVIELWFGSDSFGKTSSVRPSTIRANTDEFVSRLFQMAPAASKIKISGYCFKWCLPEPAMPYFIQLVLKLCQSFKHIEYDIRSDYDKLTNQQVDTIRDLVHLDYYINDDKEEALQLARQNAPTLQSLIIYFSSITDISSLIQDSDGSYAEYPCLRTLELHNDSELDRLYSDDVLFSRTELNILRLPVFAGAIPFPGLRRLCIQIDYPFGDDTLFRGNSATLEYLDLQLFPAFIDRVNHYKVFTPDSHPKLRYIRTIQLVNYKLPNFATAEAYMRFALSVGPHAQLRMIHDLPYHAEFHLFPPLFDGFADIRTLSLSNTCPAFWDVVSLITRLPNLSYLCTNSPRFGRMPSSVTVRKLPAFVISKYAPVSERFRRWHFDYEYNCKPSEIARCVLLLALVCPNFDFINPHYYRHPRLMSHMKRVAGLQGFKDHTKRLQRLLTEP